MVYVGGSAQRCRVSRNGARVAGRRSAGVGSQGGTRVHTHAVGVWAACACLRSQRAICGGGGHKCFLIGQNTFLFNIPFKMWEFDEIALTKSILTYKTV